MKWRERERERRGPRSHLICLVDLIRYAPPPQHTHTTTAITTTSPHVTSPGFISHRSTRFRLACFVDCYRGRLANCCSFTLSCVTVDSFLSLFVLCLPARDLSCGLNVGEKRLPHRLNIRETAPSQTEYWRETVLSQTEYRRETAPS